MLTFPLGPFEGTAGGGCFVGERRGGVGRGGVGRGGGGFVGLFDALYITLIVGTDTDWPAAAGECLTSLEEEEGLIAGLDGLKIYKTSIIKILVYYYYYYYHYYHYYYYYKIERRGKRKLRGEKQNKTNYNQ